MRRLLFFIAFVVYGPGTGAQEDTVQKVIPGRSNSPEQQAKPYVIMISADGFRFDYPRKHQAVYLEQFGKNGVRARYMNPSFPSLTFPNHYTLATGLYPSHHGLVGNNFHDRSFAASYSMGDSGVVRDGRWYGGTPLWVLAEQQQLLSASFYWVGSEAPVNGILPTYYYHYNEDISIERRIRIVVDWLKLPEDRRPHLVMFYMPEVDHAGHSFGPDARETGEAVRALDTALWKLVNAVKTTGLDVNYIFVSDHGMTAIDTSHIVLRPPFDTARVVPAISGELIQLYARNKADIPSLYQSLKKEAVDYSVVYKNELPARLHYGEKDDVRSRIGDILLIPDWPYTFTAKGRKPKVGAHGFDPYKVTDMRAIFYAWGPGLKQRKKIRPVHNTDVYYVVTSLLGLDVTEKTDGKKNLARKIVR